MDSGEGPGYLCVGPSGKHAGAAIAVPKPANGTIKLDSSKDNPPQNCQRWNSHAGNNPAVRLGSVRERTIRHLLSSIPHRDLTSKPLLLPPINEQAFISAVYR
jgi:hypothetical protein